MNRIHPAALTALAAEAVKYGTEQGIEAWLQTPYLDHGAAIAAVWDGNGPGARLHVFIAATPYGSTIVRSDVVRVARDARDLMDREDRVVG